jgi:hypothetical protein
MWFVKEKLALGREVARSARALTDNVGLDGKFAAEVLRQALHRLILVTIEMQVLSLVRHLMPARPPARIYPLSAPQS